MPATVAYRDEGEKPDGSRYEMVAWSVPESEAFPEGLKYSFQYMDADGETLLRYDNSPHHLNVVSITGTPQRARSRSLRSRDSPTR